MHTEQVLAKILDELKDIKLSIHEIENDLHADVKPEYIEKLKKLETLPGKRFSSKERLLEHLNNGV